MFAVDNHVPEADSETMLKPLALLFLALNEPSPSDCAYDRELELAREYVAFDQTEGQGWRPLYDEQCFIEAAQLLRDWQALHGHKFDLANPRDLVRYRITVWHEAQMWAFAGRNDTALPKLLATYRPDDSHSASAWNHYVTGTLAFLQRDRRALEAAIAKLELMPKPAGWDKAVGQDGKPISRPWPQNLDVLQSLLSCWDQPYASAYVCRDLNDPPSEG